MAGRLHFGTPGDVPQSQRDQVHPVPSAPNLAPCSGPRRMQVCPGTRALAPAVASPPPLPSPCLFPSCHPRWVRPLLDLPGHLLAIPGFSSVEGRFPNPDLLSGSPHAYHAGGSRSDAHLCLRPSHNRREIRTISDFWTLLGARPSMQESQEMGFYSLPLVRHPEGHGGQ